jgi:hypothetical protein
MDNEDIPPFTPERWLANLIEAADQIADKEHQEGRWTAPDALAWENPAELICSLYDDCAFERFLDEYDSTFSEEQRKSAFELKDEMNCFNEATPQWLKAAEVLADPRWESIRRKAAAFSEAFKGRWPIGSSQTSAS